MTYETLKRASEKAEDRGKKKTKFKKLDVIATFLIFQDLTSNKLFKMDSAAHEKLAEYLRRPRKSDGAGRSTSGQTIAAYYETFSRDNRDGVHTKKSIWPDLSSVATDAGLNRLGVDQS